MNKLLIWIFIFSLSIQSSFAAVVKMKEDAYLWLLLAAIIIAPIFFWILKILESVLKNNGIVFTDNWYGYYWKLKLWIKILLSIYKWIKYIFFLSLIPIVSLIVILIVVIISSIYKFLFWSNTKINTPKDKQQVEKVILEKGPPKFIKKSWCYFNWKKYIVPIDAYCATSNKYNAWLCKSWYYEAWWNRQNICVNKKTNMYYYRKK